MIVVALEALAGIAVSLSLPMSLGWVVQQRTGNSGWVDTIWTFSVGLAGAGSALWPIALRLQDDQSRTSAFFPLPPQKGVVA